MESVELFSQLLCCNSAAAWRNLVFKLGSDRGYEQILLAIFPDHQTPVEAEFAFLHSNYSTVWRNKYDADKLWHIDPTVAHCINKTIPLIWSPDIFSARPQKKLYEEACSYGLCAGVTLPIHGAKGEFGILCFATDTKPDTHFLRQACRMLPELSCFRDFIFESSLQFMKPPKKAEQSADITCRELECLKWSATGKSSWEIGQILRCSETTVNFHFNNLRRKFNVTSRQQAVVKAIRLGLIPPT